MNNNTFSYEDLATMSEGIIALIEKASQAQKLVCDNKSNEAIKEYMARLQGLNTKICNEMRQKSAMRWENLKKTKINQ